MPRIVGKTMITRAGSSGVTYGFLSSNRILSSCRMSELHKSRDCRDQSRLDPSLPFSFEFAQGINYKPILKIFSVNTIRPGYDPKPLVPTGLKEAFESCLTPVPS